MVHMNRASGKKRGHTVISEEGGVRGEKKGERTSRLVEKKKRGKER